MDSEMIKEVYRDSNGLVINIGSWDSIDPPPEGFTKSEEECVIGWDGGVYTKSDPRAARQSNHEPTSS